MVISSGVEGLANLPAGAVLSIGNFDGVHRGHRALLARARALRGEVGGTSLAVATFEPHPLTVLRPERVPPRLASPEVKQALLAEQGVEHLVILPPEPAVLNLAAEAFFGILRDRTRPSAMIEGPDFTFGKGRGGTIQRLAAWCAEASIRLEVMEPVEVALLDCHRVPVSSSLIRWLLAMGRVRDAAIGLGRGYAVRGEVVRGHQRGRKIGTPTANLRVQEQMVPADGVYSGRCEVGGETYAVAMSIGTMPTFGDHLERQVEAHLVDFEGDLYGQVLEVELTDWLRGQHKYASVEALKAQLALDVAAARQRVGLDAARPVVSVNGRDESWMNPRS